MRKQLKIYGAGMAGLICAHILRRHNPVVFEAKESLPNNHSALLRFRTDEISRATNIPFKKVKVQKAIFYKGEIHTTPSLQMSNLYSLKCTGAILKRSIDNLDPVTRYIAPKNFTHLLANGIKIEFGKRLEAPEPCISTIPMNFMMEMVGWKNKPDFKFQTIWALTLNLSDIIDCEIYQTLYYPEDTTGYYRASITGDVLIIEYIKEQQPDDYKADIKDVLKSFGINVKIENFNYEVKQQKFGKLLPIDSKKRKEFIMALTDLHGIYSLGRFSTWRQILLDDIVKDAKKIDEFISNRDSYERKIKGSF